MHDVAVVGRFNGWDVNNPLTLSSIGNSQYSGTVRVAAYESFDEFEYKYILNFNDGNIQWDEPGLDDAVNDNRRFYPSGAVDQNADEVPDLVLDTEIFGYITSIEDIRNLPDGLHVKTEGVATTPNFESASRTSFFIQQDGFGLNIFNFGTPARIVNAGDLLRVQGTVATFNGLKEIILDVPDEDVFTVETGMEVPAPREITFEQFKNAAFIETDVDNVQGSLVRLNGLSTDPTSWPQDINAGSSNVSATMNDSTVAIRLMAQTEAIGVTPPAMMDIIGVVGTYNGAQLHPRFASDIVGPGVILPLPEPPYAFGDTINYNGSFANFELGPKTEANEAWFFDTNNGSSTYEIVDDAQDADGKALKIGVAYNGSPEIWHVQAINEPLNVASGDYYVASFWAKASDEGRNAHAFFGLPEAGGYAEVSMIDFPLSTEWTEYSFSYLAGDFDQEVGMRFGFSMNFAENDGAMIYFDNLQITKMEPQFTDVEFTVNMAVQMDLWNFNPESQSVGVVGGFNGWDTGNPAYMDMVNDSLFGVTVSLLDAQLMDTVEYKFIMVDNNSGVFEWESPEPGSPNTTGEFQNRYFVVNDLDLVTTPTVYHHNVDRADQNPDTYGISSIFDARNSPLNSHLAVQGIVTRTTTNWVFIQDETAATMAFSRPFFSDLNAISFNDAVINSEINPGDEIKIASMTGDYFGLHELIRMHGWDVVSTGNELPAPQMISVSDLNMNGEEVESELVRLENIHLVDKVDTLFAGQYYMITDEMETDYAYMYIPGPANSFWAFEEAPIDVFTFEGVVLEQYYADIDQNIHAIVPISPEDLQDPEPTFDALFELPSFAGLVNNTFALPLELTELGGDAIEGFRFKLMFDPSVVNISVDEDQTGTLVDGITLEINESIPGEILIGGMDANGITSTGTFMNFTIELLSDGYTDIHLAEVDINEMGLKEEPWAFVHVVLRLCGDVTGDETVSALDAVSVLRHSVRLSPEYPLTGLDSTAADVTGNGVITPYDGAKILQYEVGLIDGLACIDLPLKGEPEVANANWNLNRADGNESTVKVSFGNSEFDIYSVQFMLEMTEGLEFTSITNLPDSWNVMQNFADNMMIISAYGISPIEDKSLELNFDTRSVNGLPKVKGEVLFNESKAPALEELIIGDAPTELMLSQNYPNPFNPATNISYSLPNKAKVELSIYNMLGQRVASLVNATQDVGNYTVTWKADNLSSGVYIYRLTVDSQVFTKRMMLVK